MDSDSRLGKRRHTSGTPQLTDYDAQPPSRIFISYRRDDTSGFAGRLHDALVAHFGEPRVFRDIETIEPGVDFVDAIDEAVRGCRVLLAVLGREWLTCTDASGRRRLDDPADFVRLELKIALERDIRVIPVLVENAAMPSAQQLPEPLTRLARHNALEISDARWEHDVGRLIAHLERLVGPALPIPTPQDWRSRLRRTIRSNRPLAVTIAFLALLAVAGAFWALVSLFAGSRDLKPMTGDFNIAVAPFTALDREGRPVDSTEAPALAQSVHERLRAELAGLEESGFDLRLRSPDEIGELRGSTPEQRAASAAAIARRHEADVIVYGTLRMTDPGEFTPEFFVSEDRLQGAEEFVGDYQLGSAVELAGDISRNAVARKELRDQVLGRMGALAEFIVGLGYAALDQWEPAFERFKKAELAEGWPDADGKEVLYLFLGNAAVKLRDLHSAERFYDRALALNREYSRALVGKAEVQLHRARGGCEQGTTDPAGLAMALDTLARAELARVQPALADVRTKVAFGQGRIYLCMSQALIADRWDDAERAFGQVIDEYLKDNTRVRTIAAEAYAGRGFAFLPVAGDSDWAHHFRRAAAEYEKAAELFPDNDPEHRRAFFWSMLGFIYERLGEAGRANDAYGRAIDLAADDPALRARYEADRDRLTQTS